MHLKILRGFITFILALSLASPASVLAISDLDKDAILNNTPFYDPTAIQTGCFEGDFSGRDSAQIIFNYLVSKGFSLEQSAGFVGNFYVETVGTFDPTIENFSGSGARGIAQWLGGRQERLIEFGDAQGKDPWILATQLEFVWFELTGEPVVPGVDGGYEGPAYEAILATTTVAEAAETIDRRYERSEGTTIPERIAQAELAYAEFAGEAAKPGETTALNCGGIGISLDGFVFPIKTTQSAVGWCSNSFSNCHGAAWAGTYYAYDIFEKRGGGAEVVAVRDGIIRGFNPDYRCVDPQLSMWIEGTDGIWYFYQHLDATVLVVGEGESVTAGQTLGVIGPNAYVGGTCSNTSPHVHFAASHVRTSMYRGCSQADCPNMDQLIDIASVLKAAYDALPQ